MDIFVHMNFEVVMQVASELAVEPGPVANSCPVHAFQSLISGKYKLRIIWDLRSGPMRYNEIRRGLLVGLSGSEEIAPRVLSRELKGLVGMGLLNRIDYQQLPLRVEYALTDTGQSLLPTIRSIHQWTVKNLAL